RLHRRRALPCRLDAREHGRGAEGTPELLVPLHVVVPAALLGAARWLRQRTIALRSRTGTTSLTRCTSSACASTARSSRSRPSPTRAWRNWSSVSRRAWRPPARQREGASSGHLLRLDPLLQGLADRRWRAGRAGGGVR